MDDGHDLGHTMYRTRSVVQKASHLLGHGLLLKQADVCAASPSHSFPPCSGRGLSQVRVRDLSPSPQVVAHADHSVHSDHSPSSAADDTLVSLFARLCPLAMF